MNKSYSSRPLLKTLSLIISCASLTACGDFAWWANDKEPVLKADQIKSVIPARVRDRDAWAQDIHDIMQDRKSVV